MSDRLSYEKVMFSQHVIMITQQQIGSILDCKSDLDLLSYRNLLLENAFAYWQFFIRNVEPSSLPFDLETYEDWSRKVKK